MKDSTQDDDPLDGGELVSPAAVPFGAGVAPDAEAGAEAGSEAGAEAGAGAVPAARTLRRVTTFKCALGGVWQRARAADMQRALEEVEAQRLRQQGGFPNSRGGWSREGLAAQQDGAQGSAAPWEDLGDILDEFGADGRREEARAHFELSPALTFEWLQGRLDGLEDAAGGAPVPPVPHVLRLHVSETTLRQCQRVLGILLDGSSVVVLSDAVLPTVAEAVVEWVRSVWPSAPVALLHDDGLDCLRAAATMIEVAVHVVDPDAGVSPALLQLRRTREDLEAKREAEARSGGRSVERLEDGKRPKTTGPPRAASPGWFGTGVVAAPLPPLTLVAEVQEPLLIDEAADPAAAAETILERAFGAAVLGGFAATAVSRVAIPARLFSRVTTHLLDALELADDDARYDPPFWRVEASTPGLGLVEARRLGLDEGATLIHERRGAREDGKAYGLVFTNGEARMRSGSDARALGTLVLMRAVSPFSK